MTRELVHRQRPPALPAQRAVNSYQSRRRGCAARREPILRVEHRSFGVEHLQEVAGALLEPQAEQRTSLEPMAQSRSERLNAASPI